MQASIYSRIEKCPVTLRIRVESTGMSNLRPDERSNFEQLFGMSSGYVLDFSDRTFGQFFEETVGIDIHSSKYSNNGTSKANKLRSFFHIEEDQVVGKVLQALLSLWAESTDPDPRGRELFVQCQATASRLLAGSVNLHALKETAKRLNAVRLAEQIHRMEQAVHTDPSLAIGTAKELLETVCKTILAERGKPVSGLPDVPTLTKDTFKELGLVPDGVPEENRGGKLIKVLLSNLGSVANNLAELRNLYGTGHGPIGTDRGLEPRHAKLAVGAAATLSMFLFETHKATSS